MFQIEYVLLVWMYVAGGVVSPPMPIEVYPSLETCEAARDTVTVENPEVIAVFSTCQEVLR